MDHVLFKEDIDDLAYVGQRFVVLDEHLGEHAALIWVDAHDATQQEHIVGRVADFFGIEHNLLELARLGKAL